jgi:hypothetical protein
MAAHTHNRVTEMAANTHNRVAEVAAHNHYRETELLRWLLILTMLTRISLTCNTKLLSRVQTLRMMPAHQTDDAFQPGELRVCHEGSKLYEASPVLKYCPAFPSLQMLESISTVHVCVR